ncbi:MAG: U32 family peptidase [Ruminococcaceae bacterium]|nr:U32 family peptidase [Oscillospiraceae bacterium]
MDKITNFWENIMEILSPAGDFESLIAAVQNGADAVYVGGSDFSARKNAKNFNDFELNSAIDYCHLRGVKLYVACNTLIKEQEINFALEFLAKIYEMGADSVIVQDLGLVSLLAEQLPDFPIHASTQMTVHTLSGVNVLADNFGVKRVVLSRELSYDEIAQIRNNTKTELEVFVHGALCMSYSGECLFSSVLGGRSGNRGSCAQPCRLPYTLIKGEEEVTKTLPLLSPKDLCLADEIYKFNKLGIDSLKIEGRMKSPEYVAKATKVYSEAKNIGADREEIEKLISIFSRSGSSKGYFYGRTFADQMGYQDGSKISASRETMLEAKRSFKGENVKIPINMFFYGAVGEEIILTISDEKGQSVTVFGDVMEQAESRPLGEERIKEQLKKLGQTPFDAEYIEVATDGGFVSVKAINALRRDAIEKFQDKICTSKKREKKEIFYSKKENEKAYPIKLTAEVRTREQYNAVQNLNIDGIFMPYDLYKEINPDNAVCVLPPILKDSDKVNLEGIQKVEINNIGQLALCKGKKVYMGYSMNITNSAAFSALCRLGAEEITVSTELTVNEIKNIGTDEAVKGAMVYGRQRLMYMENCVIKSAYGCSCNENNFYLKDRLSIKFPIITENCRNVLLNSRPTYMADKPSDIKNMNLGTNRLVFTTESGEETKRIVLAYKNALSGEATVCDCEFTRGHFLRGTF